MKTSISQHLVQSLYSPLHSNRYSPRSRSSHPQQFVHTVNSSRKIQTSSSQPTLNYPVTPNKYAGKKSPMLLSSSAASSHTPSTSSSKSEKFNENDIIIDPDGTILSGSVESLVRRLFPREGCPTSNYVFTLLLNIRTIMSPEELMQKIVQHVMFSQNSTSDNFKKEGRLRMCTAVLRLCTEWTGNIPYDFRSEQMRERLNELLGFCSVDHPGRQKAEEIQKGIKNTLSKLDRYEKALACLMKKESESTVSTADTLCGLIKVCDCPQTIAYQLTHIELERFSMIGVDEVMDALAKSEISCLGKEKNNAGVGNISHYVEWFNRLSSFVAGDILRHSRKRHRVMVIEYWIDIAKECINIGNFNSLMAIVAGLSLPSVARLKKTWSRVEKAKLEILQHQLDPSGNFLSYRATMKAALWRAKGTRANYATIIIPFFVLLLKDMYLVYHSSPRVMPNGHLNFLAFTQLSEHFVNLLEWKSATCSFSRNQCVLQNLLIVPVYNEKELMLMSFECEDAENSTEKENLKSLRLGKS